MGVVDVDEVAPVRSATHPYPLLRRRSSSDKHMAVFMQKGGIIPATAGDAADLYSTHDSNGVIDVSVNNHPRKRSSRVFFAENDQIPTPPHEERLHHDLSARGKDKESLSSTSPAIEATNTRSFPGRSGSSPPNPGAVSKSSPQSEAAIPPLPLSGGSPLQEEEALQPPPSGDSRGKAIHSEEAAVIVSQRSSISSSATPSILPSSNHPTRVSSESRSAGVHTPQLLRYTNTTPSQTLATHTGKDKESNSNMVGVRSSRGITPGRNGTAVSPEIAKLMKTSKTSSGIPVTTIDLGMTGGLKKIHYPHH